jgi:hypothetical protein
MDDRRQRHLAPGECRKATSRAACIKTTDLRHQDIPSSAIPEVNDTDRTSVRRPFHCSARSGDLGEQAFNDRVQVQITVNRKDIENGKHASRTSSIRREPQKRLFV